ncbi:hypothetical protein [Streptomyces fuscichromogenes]|uniref:Uncharacterized protein n=1 Tax=Streptomyces fuscichromogenes TaxID=1324013 RepID=A0A917X904_9ACTN|nr:hypothetical protein [Streptomyces fuscichromogenes]GGM94698.1 hypothetical protein GCM10011578_013820 [Streptomyces fuscichromogenes]
MDTSTEFMRSELPDLSGTALSDLRSRNPDVYARALERLLRQIAQPRVNFATDPGPGRAD